MATLLLSCDDAIIFNNGRYFAGSDVKYDFYQRYLRVFDHLVLVCRCVNEKVLKSSRIPLDNDCRISVVYVPDFHGPVQYARKYIKVGISLENALKGIDAAILRIPSTIALRVGELILSKKIPYAVEVVFDAQDAWEGSSGIDRFLWKIIDKQMRVLCANADGVSCVTEFSLQRHYCSQKRGSFVSHYSSISLPQSFYGGRKEFPRSQPFVLSHVSNQIQFDGRKGHNQIIEALSLLKKRGFNVVARFAGGDYNGGIEKLKKLARKFDVYEMIEFVGFLDRKGLDDFLSNADVFVMPTKAEGLPRVIIEALAKGLPVITTPVSGNPELIEKRFLVDYYDVERLACLIGDLFVDGELYEKTSERNYKRSLEFESSILESRRDEFYGKLLSNGLTA